MPVNAPTMTFNALDSDDKGLCRLGGIAALAIGVAYIAIILLYAGAGAPPTGGLAWLEYLAGRTSIWWAIVGLSVLTNFLYVPVALALYFALKRIDRNVMLIAVACVGLFVVLEPAVNWASYGAILVLSGNYASAIDEVQRQAYVAAANFASAVLASPLAGVYAIGTLSFGFLLIGLVMLKGVFNKLTAYLGVITGILGIVAVAGVSIAVILNAVCATIWLFLVGYRLFRLAQ
jgi:hypothetical protein